MCFGCPFTNGGGYTADKEFVGLKNFKTLFGSDKFYQAFQNTILLIVVVTIVTFAMALIFAAILSREKIKGQNFFRVIFYIPNILSVVVISAIFSAIYDPNQGLLNSILNLFRGSAGAEDPILWLGSQKLVIYSIAIAMVWQAIGYYMVMYMASMANVPESLYESANLEGAGRIRQFFSITLPLIWTNIRTTLTFFIISTINMSFLFVKAMTNGNPDGASNVFLSYMYLPLIWTNIRTTLTFFIISTINMSFLFVKAMTNGNPDGASNVFLSYMYQEAYTNSSYGYGMAIGAVVFIFSFALAGVLNAVTKRDEIEF